jgi:hypothetical protein
VITVDKVQVGKKGGLPNVGFLDANTEIILKGKEGSNVNLKGESTQ